VSGPTDYRVCQVTDSGDPGGAERVVCLLCEEYARRGVRQDVVLIQDGWLRGELRRRGFEPTLLESTGSLDLGWIRAFARLLRDRRVDVVHGHLLDANFYATCGARLAGVASVVTEHGDAAMGSKRGWRYTLKLAAAQLLADRVAAVSEGARASLLQRVRLGRAKTEIIPNGIDAARYAAGLAPAARVGLGAPAGARLVAAVGALTDVKAHHVLLRAHAMLPPDVWCAVIGDGERREALERLATELGTRERVVFPGFRDDVPEILRSIDVLCLPSLTEGMPLILLEALAAGTTIVASAVGGIPEMLGRAGGGEVVEPDRPDLLAAALARALAGEVPKGSLPEEWRREAMADAYLDLYARILARSPRHGASAALAP
jgi:glycosyltransferase involved in cell wall biosynthesis